MSNCGRQRRCLILTNLRVYCAAPDVWLQLLERCAAQPGAQSTALRSLAQQLPEHKAQTAQLQQQESDQQ
jgi:hypothetical protein